MPTDQNASNVTSRILVKLRPTAALRAAGSRANLRPLYDGALAAPFGASTDPRWFVADLPEPAPSPWDLAHSRVAGQLGVADSDVVFAEPDTVHDIYRDANERAPGAPFAVGETCVATPQDSSRGKAVGPDSFAWHLQGGFSQLGAARDEVEFTAPRTRIAHLDTGYYRAHETVPEHVLAHLERNFVERDANPGSAEDPDNRLLLLDNSGHGTGTIGILAGGRVPAEGGIYLGGAPGAEVLPLRVADSVVLLRTSALARALRYATEQRCDVVTLSMGGLPSQAWSEAVDEAYERGVCICAAAGNRIGASPPGGLVYPARYDRVIGVCGVMANDAPYTRLKGTALEGVFGPESAMRTAIAAYTPNIPWPRFGCRDVVRLDGEGTSSATPQVAAAAALWFEKYKEELPRDWRRVEAVRRALFTSAKLRSNRTHFGNGVLQARAALRVRPVLGLPKARASDHSFAFLRVLTGLGMVEPPPRERMFNLELLQRWMLNDALQEVVPDPAGSPQLSDAQFRRLMEAIIEDESASLALRRHMAARYPLVTGRSPQRTPRSRLVVPDPAAVCDQVPAVPDPPYRRLRVYAVDPSLSTRLATAGINDAALDVRWEPLEPGPVGEYFAIEDVDATGRRYDGVDLNDPRLLAQDGWAPSEGNPQFHQQMVYAVAMKTIEHFERALGRPVLWRPARHPTNDNDDSRFVRQLRIRPHAVRQANAFYSPDEVALLFGYFEASGDDPGHQMPGSRVYACLSHDIIAHETTHAVLDGMHRRFNEPTNPDVLALHEAFADIVALMQHFTIRQVLEQEIARTRGDIETESLLGSLAVQFGRAIGGRGALRDAIGRMEDGAWRRLRPDPADLQRRLTPHARGAVLVAAVFDAFIAIYNERTADLLRIYTGGTGVLPAGAIHPDLVRRLAGEAAKSAGHVLTMCIRALDYLPPVDVTFFEYLRALITADFDLVTDDRHNYRVAFVEAFRRRGIYPVNLETPTANTPRTLSVDTLRWQGFDPAAIGRRARPAMREQYRRVLDGLRRYADRCLYLEDREQLFAETRRQRRLIHGQLSRAFAAVPDLARELGLDRARRFEVHELRRALRVGPDGQHIPQVVVALTQSEAIEGRGVPRHLFRGGSTLVVDLAAPAITYRIVKNINSADRRERTAAFVRDAAADPFRTLLLAPGRREPFAALHALAEEDRP